MIVRLLLILFSFILLLPGTTAAAKNFIFRGQIVDTANQPVHGAEVYVFDSNNIKRPADFISNRTANDGYFLVELPLGNYWTLAIMRQSGAKFGPLGKDDKHSGEPIEIRPPDKGEVIQDFTIMDLQEAARSNQKRSEKVVKITGHVLDKNGNPAALTYVMADTNQRFGRMPRYLSTWTTASGSYTIFLPMGSYFLGASKDFPPNNDYILGKKFVFEQDTSNVDLIVDDADYLLGHRWLPIQRISELFSYHPHVRDYTKKFAEDILAQK